jgi:hypothetical protein
MVQAVQAVTGIAKRYTKLLDKAQTRTWAAPFKRFELLERFEPLELPSCFI